MKSQFDSNNWSDINGLPGQQDILNFMEHFTQKDPHRCFTRRQLMEEIAKEFNIPATSQEADGPDSNTPGYYTRVTYLISDAVHGVRRSNDNPFLKRIQYNVYQHAKGSGQLSVEMREFLSKNQPLAKVSKSEVEECRVSVKLLKSLDQTRFGEYTPERIMVELGGRVWNDQVIEQAIKQEFPGL